MYDPRADARDRDEGRELDDGRARVLAVVRIR
jgi:hypothetical protein